MNISFLVAVVFTYTSFRNTYDYTQSPPHPSHRYSLESSSRKRSEFIAAVTDLERASSQRGQAEAKKNSSEDSADRAAIQNTSGIQKFETQGYAL